MIITLSVPEVHKLRHLLYKAHVDTYNKTYDIKGEPLYSYDKEKREAKKLEIAQLYAESGRYLGLYHYWDNLIGFMRTTTPPYLTDFGVVDVDMNEVQQILTFLHDQLISYDSTLDTEEVSSAYHYWVRVLTGDNNEK